MIEESTVTEQRDQYQTDLDQILYEIDTEGDIDYTPYSSEDIASLEAIIKTLEWVSEDSEFPPY